MCICTLLLVRSLCPTLIPHIWPSQLILPSYIKLNTPTFVMRFTHFISAELLALSTSATPVEKRAALTDVANIGYATQNGGYAHAFQSQRIGHLTDRNNRTKGGQGGPTTTYVLIRSLQHPSIVKPHHNNPLFTGCGITDISNRVTTLAQLQAVANATGPQIILIQGNIKGAAKVQVGSDKSIIGKSGSCMSSLPRPHCLH